MPATRFWKYVDYMNEYNQKMAASEQDKKVATLESLNWDKEVEALRNGR